MNKKLTYEQPSCDLFVIKVEEGFLQASQFSSKGTELMTVDTDEDF